MDKVCFSVMTEDFKKCLAKMDADHAKKILDTISHLEEMENDRTKIPHGKMSPETVVGNRLTSLNKNTYALKTQNFDRALAVVVKKEGKKVYIWYWGGSHEEYNKEIKPNKLQNTEKLETNKNAQSIDSQLSQMKSKEEVAENIRSMSKSKKEHKKNRYK